MNRFKELYETLIKYSCAYTQQDFSDQVGIARTIVSQLLNGKKELTEKHIHKICIAYTFVNEQWLREGIGEMFLITPIPISPPKKASCPKRDWKEFYEFAQKQNEVLLQLIVQLKNENALLRNKITAAAEILVSQK
jgi:transcriptional regulator with XRE-family HTH domain